MTPLSTQNDAMASSRVLYEDNHLLAVYKPAGLLTQGDRTGEASLLDWARAYLKEKYQKPGNVFLGLVHRLDKNVPGVVLLAKTSKGASRLSEQFRRRSVTKRYLAVVEGTPAPQGLLVHFLDEAGDRGVTVRQDPAEGFKRAELRYTRLETTSKLSLLEVELLTGRKHQIRAQLAAMGHPIVGDRKYGSKHAPAANAIALLAYSLRFKLATRDEEMEVALPEARSELRRFYS